MNELANVKKYKNNHVSSIANAIRIKYLEYISTWLFHNGVNNIEDQSLT